jgi:hypothetical protein
MNIFLLSATQRILEWRKFRSSLNNLPELEQLNQVSKFWASAPLTVYALDWDQPNTWPSAWQLISEGNFDSIVIAYLMEQTLILAGWDPARLQLIYLRNAKISDQMMIVLIDNLWALNYSVGEVFDYSKIKTDSILMVKYQMRDGKRVQL